LLGFLLRCALGRSCNEDGCRHGEILSVYVCDVVKGTTVEPAPDESLSG
jgi:hypothetical protein